MEMISVIIPVYNAENTITRCVDSVLRQTYREIEVILVNDGSKDNTLKLATNYAELDKRVKVIDKPNEGVSSARNHGIETASGKWIFFLDADDWIEPGLFQDYIEAAKDSDLVISGFVEFGASKDSFFVQRFANFRFNNQIKDITSLDSNEIPIVKLLLYCWGKLFKRDIINKHRIRFREDIKFSEDYMFVMNYLMNVESVTLTRSNKLHYYVAPSQGKYLMNFDNYQRHILVLNSLLEQGKISFGDCFYSNYEYLRKIIFSNFLSFLRQLNSASQFKYEIRKYNEQSVFKIEELYLKEAKYIKYLFYKLVFMLPSLGFRLIKMR